MNHHFRSYSEQPQLAPAPAATASGNNTGGAPPQSIIRIHSDSQQSLDQLFNQTLSSVPLRNRNLPSSFFNPSVKTEGETNGVHDQDDSTSPMLGVNNFHSRSISLAGPVTNASRPNTILRQNFHTRTHSTLAPMPRLDSNHSSHQSSNEFINTTSNNTNNNNNNNNSNSTNNVSSCQQHGGENIVSSTSTNNHNHTHHNHHQNHHHHQIHSNVSNGWSSQENSIDDLNNTTPHGWLGGGGAPTQLAQQQLAQQQPIVQPAPMQIVHQHHHSIMQAEQAIPTTAIRHQHQQHLSHHQQQQQQPHSAPFYQQSQQQHQHQVGDTTIIGEATPNQLCPTHSLHSRSMSVQQPAMHGGVVGRANHNHLHMRTHSTTEPACNHHVQVASHHSSHQSSREFLNHSSATSASIGTTGWSTSSGCSTDDMSASSGGGWAPTLLQPHNHQHHHHQHAHVQHQPSPVISQQTAHLHIAQQSLGQPLTMEHHHQAATTGTTMPQHGHNGHHHHHHHHAHIPMQVQHSPQQVPQQIFYNV